MKLASKTFEDGGPIPPRCAFGVYDPKTHVRLSDNRNPHLAWSDLPEGTRSLVIVCHDSDVPSRGDDVNQEGRTVPADLPRVDFFHWVLVDLPPEPAEIAEGEVSDGVTARGKPGPAALRGARHGINDYTGWFRGDPDMEGTYYGYDGPCPPWNDEIVHHYHFTMYALDLEKLPVEGTFGGDEVRRAMDGHILGQARITGTYHINPNAREHG